MLVRVVVKGSAADAALDDGIAPPIAICVTCGLTLCAGCAPPGLTPLESLRLPWEDARQPWWRRLWRTALDSSLEPRRFFGELPDGHVGSAIAFAACAEACALGSLGLLAALGFWLAAPELSSRVLGSRAGRVTLGVVWVASVLGMLGLHALWGACLDWATQRPGARRGRWEQGIRFGLYACGWDLLTSPIGVLGTLLSRGPLRAWSPIGAAARAPGPAQRAYLELRRGADATAQRRARRLAALAVGSALLVMLLLCAGALMFLAQRFGY